MIVTLLRLSGYRCACGQGHVHDNTHAQDNEYDRKHAQDHEYDRKHGQDRGYENDHGHEYGRNSVRTMGIAMSMAVTGTRTGYGNAH